MTSFDGILGIVGNTQLVHLKKLFPKHQIFGKCEWMNPGGSIKDRTALYILKKALEKGLINQETTIIESSSGNMGIGLAQCCLYLGLKLKIVIDPYINSETVNILKAYQVDLVKVTEPDENGAYLNQRIAKVKELLKEIHNSYWTSQYDNTLNPETHQITMDEIVEQLGSEPDYIFVATSTCGTLMGVANYVFNNQLKTKIIPVDAFGSVIFGGDSHKRIIPGFGAAKKSILLDESKTEEASIMKEWESIVGCRNILKHEAMLVGGSSGAVVEACFQKMSEIEADKKVVLILCDRGERYMDTLFNDDWISQQYGKEVLDFINARIL